MTPSHVLNPPPARRCGVNGMAEQIAQKFSDVAARVESVGEGADVLVATTLVQTMRTMADDVKLGRITTRTAETPRTAQCHQPRDSLLYCAAALEELAHGHRSLELNLVHRNGAPSGSDGRPRAKSLTQGLGLTKSRDESGHHKEPHPDRKADEARARSAWPFGHLNSCDNINQLI